MNMIKTPMNFQFTKTQKGLWTTVDTWTDDKTIDKQDREENTNKIEIVESAKKTEKIEEKKQEVVKSEEVKIEEVKSKDVKSESKIESESKKSEKDEIHPIDKELFSLIASWKRKYGPIELAPDEEEEEKKQKKLKKEQTESLLSGLQEQIKVWQSGETVKEFLESSILSKKEINQIYDYINDGQLESAKSFLDLTTVDFHDKKKAK